MALTSITLTKMTEDIISSMLAGELAKKRSLGIVEIFPPDDSNARGTAEAILTAECWSYDYATNQGEAWRYVG